MPGDPERTHARAAMSMAIIKGLEAIAQHQFEANTVQEYDSLPLNKDFDGLEMILEGIAIHDTLGNYQADLGIRRVKTSCNPEDFIDDSHDLRVMNIGDLSSTPSIIRTKLNGYTLKGTHKDLYIGCKTSEITLVAPDGSCINAYTLIENNTRDFDSDKTK
jgi:hypothetical protein